MALTSNILNILYSSFSLFLYVLIVFYWGVSSSFFGMEITNYELLFISFFICNYVYLAAIDIISHRNVYYELTKNSAQVMTNFAVVIFVLLLVNSIATGKSKIQLSELNLFILFSIGVFYTIVSIVTNYIFIRKGLK